MLFSRSSGKRVSAQFGCKRITIRDIASVGSSKIMDVWVLQKDWRADPYGVIEKLCAAACSFRNLTRDQIQVEFP